MDGKQIALCVAGFVPVALMAVSVMVFRQSQVPCDDLSVNYVAEFKASRCANERADVFRLMDRKDLDSYSGPIAVRKVGSQGDPMPERFIAEAGAVVREDTKGTPNSLISKMKGVKLTDFQSLGYEPVIPMNQEGEIPLKQLPQEGNYIVTWSRLIGSSRIEAIEYYIEDGKIVSRNSVTTWHSD